MSESAKRRGADPELRRRASERTKKQFADPEVRRIARDRIKEAMKDPEVRRRISEKAKKRFEDPEQHRKASESAKMRPPPTSETRDKISAATKGRSKPFSKEHIESLLIANQSPDRRAKISAALKGRKKSEEHIRKFVESYKETCKDPKYQKNLSERAKKQFADPEVRRKASERAKARFENPKEREKTRLATIKYNVDHSWYGDVKYYDGPQYCEKWTAELRERVRAYFGYVCAECGNPQNERKLAVHHVHYNKKLCCDDTPRSLVALCASCHSLTSKGDREYWSEHFQEIIDTYYEGRCWFTKEEMKQYRSMLKE